MSATAFKPGAVWPARPVTAELLAAQWAAEIAHHGSGVDTAALAFSERDWADWEWNARECLHLNGLWPAAPAALRRVLVPQDRVNLHLIRAMQMLLRGWQQWSHLPTARTDREASFRLLTARGRLEEAQAKYDSLAGGRQLLRRFSLRQRAFLLQMATLFADLEPLAGRAAKDGPPEPLHRLLADINWHAKEALRLLGKPGDKPPLRGRLRMPLLEVNRLLASCCLYHAAFLKAAVKRG